MTTTTDTKQAWYSRRWAQVALHVIAWVTLFSLPYLLRPSPDQRHAPDPDEHLWQIHYIINAFVLILFFYLNAGVLIPKLVYRKKYLQFSGILLFFFAALVYSRRLFIVAFIAHKQFELRPDRKSVV